MRNLFQKISIAKAKLDMKLMSLTIAATAAVMNVIPVSATFQPYTGKTGTEIIDGIVNVIAAIASFVGVILLASSIFILVMAFKNEEVEGKHRAGLGIGVAIALLSFGGIMAFFV